MCLLERERSSACVTYAALYTMTRGIAALMRSHIDVCLSAVVLQRPGVRVEQCGALLSGGLKYRGFWLTPGVYQACDRYSSAKCHDWQSREGPLSIEGIIVIS